MTFNEWWDNTSHTAPENYDMALKVWEAAKTVSHEENVRRKTLARDVHYALIENFELPVGTPVSNHNVRRMLEELAGVEQK